MHALNDCEVNRGDLSEEESFWKSDLFGLVSGQHVSMVRGVRIIFILFVLVVCVTQTKYSKKIIYSICTHTQPLKMYIYEMSTYLTFPDVLSRPEITRNKMV